MIFFKFLDCIGVKINKHIQLIEEKKQRRKELREADLNKRRGLGSLQADALNRQKQFEEKVICFINLASDFVCKCVDRMQCC